MTLSEKLAEVIGGVAIASEDHSYGYATVGDLVYSVLYVEELETYDIAAVELPEDMDVPTNVEEIDILFDMVDPWEGEGAVGQGSTIAEAVANAEEDF